MKLANSLFCGRETEVTRQRRSEALSSGWCDKVISRSDPGGNWALAQRVHFSERAYFFWRPNDIKVCDFSQQSGRNFGERMLGISLTKIMAAIFYFDGSERLGREMNLYQGRGPFFSLVSSEIHLFPLPLSPPPPVIYEVLAIFPKECWHLN